MAGLAPSGEECVWFRSFVLAGRCKRHSLLLPRLEKSNGVSFSLLISILESSSPFCRCKMVPVIS